MRDDKLKQQIEAKYDAVDRAVETGQYAGQMTIAFCAAADPLTDCLNDPNCTVIIE